MFDMAKEPKSTRAVAHSVKGFLNLDEMKVVEILDENDEVSHDLREILEEYDGYEISLSVGKKDKLVGE